MAVSWMQFAALCSVVLSAHALTYNLEVVNVNPNPVLSFVDGTSKFGQVFNPSYVVASPGTQNVEGLMLRTQNCSAIVGGACVTCGGDGAKARFECKDFTTMLITCSILTFSAIKDGAPTLVTDQSVVFSPDPSITEEAYGTEDPRIQYDDQAGLYYMFYTCYGYKNNPQIHSVLLCLAVSKNPTVPSSWVRHGPVFPNAQGSKSAALLLRASGPHYLFWGAGVIRVTQSTDPTTWPSQGDLFIEPRGDMFDSAGVESGPPPLLLSSGDYLFIYNSWDKGWPSSQDPNSGYHPAYVILNGSNPAQILQRASSPFLLPQFPWEQGKFPYTCNVARVVFVEAATATANRDEFTIYFGGSDAVVGQATIRVTYS